jgi:hypothetical protein
MRALIVCTLVLVGAAAQAADPKTPELPQLSRADFNRLAIQAGSPLFWVADKNGNNTIDPDELAATGMGKTLVAFVAKGVFTPRFQREYKALVELRRREAVARELDGGRPTLVLTDFSSASAQDKALLKYLLEAAWIVEELYLHQTGGFRYWKKSAKLDAPSKALFWRNHGPWCETPGTKGDTFCNASPDFPLKRSESYPQDMVQDEAMCKLLAAQPNAKGTDEKPGLLDPFSVVERQGGGYAAVPLHKVWGKKMRGVATRLKAAAGAIAKDPSEKALYTYLLAAAKGFETNLWAEADEAWAAMSSQNSKWYLRIGPDEVYFDPCQQKAGFHVSLARIDQASLGWQKKLTPLRTAMEQAIAKLIGPPYTARQVRFQMPDFIQIVLNAGDARHPLGGAIGQSLPNWGKVVQEGRGRTMVMSNLYTDADSKRASRQQAEALLDKASLAYYTDDAEPFLLNIILHEATHNFGPFSDYRIEGKPAKQVFPGQLASTLEELKAQIGGLWYLQLLRKKNLISDKLLRQAYVDAIRWSFGHISRGMFTPSGNAQPYSQLAAISIGSFMQDGALSFKAGKFSINFDKLPASIEKLAQLAGRIKAKGDIKGGLELVKHFIKGKGYALVHEKHIAAELLRYPKASFLYSVVY